VQIGMEAWKDSREQIVALAKSELGVD